MKLKKPELNDWITWALFIILIITTIYMRETGAYNTTVYECIKQNYTGVILP